MANGTPTLSWRPSGSPVVSPLPRLWRRAAPWIDPGLKVLIPILLIIFLALAARFGSFEAYLQLLSRQTYSSFLPALGAAYTLMMLIFQLFRTILWTRYRPYPVAAGPLPFLTVIIPAYNEGAMVEKAIAAVAASDYPAEKMEIVCIDDGSLDDTWFYIQRARQRYPHLLRTHPVCRQPGEERGPVRRIHPGPGGGLRHHRLRQHRRPRRPAPPGGPLVGRRFDRCRGRQRQGV